MNEETKKDIKKSIKAPEARFKEAGFARNQWQVIAEVGTTLEDLKKPEYWAHVAMKLKPCDEIVVICEDMTYKACFDVMQSSRLWAKVFLTDFIDYTEGSETDMPAPDAEYRIKYAGPHVKYQVIRNSDQGVVKEYFPDEATASQWLKDYIKTTAKAA